MLWRSRASSPRQYPADFIEPFLPINARTLRAGPQWAYEIKHDGFRLTVVPSFASKAASAKCGARCRHIDVRPNWSEQRERPTVLRHE